MKVAHKGPYKKGKGQGAAKAKLTASKSRKEMRKQKRKEKKLSRHNHFLARTGQLVTPTEKNLETKLSKRNNSKNRKKKLKFKREQDMNDFDSDTNDDDDINIHDAENSSGAQKVSSDLKKDEEKLKLEMEKVRRKRLQEENDEEDKNIKKLEKLLKLDKRKKKKATSIPTSFKEDGLDYLLEVCEVATSKNNEKLNNETENASKPNQSDEDEEFVSGDENYDMDDEEDFENDQDDNEDMEDDKDSGNEEEQSDGEYSDNSDNDNEEKVEKKKIANDNNEPKLPKGVWEDIYGRLRNKDGSLFSGKSTDIVSAGGKYIPPALREKSTSNRDKILKPLKGLMNRLSENNMHNISQQVEALYMANSRNEMNETLIELIYATIVQPMKMSDRIILEHAMLIAILHANIGTEIGAFFIQNIVQNFRKRYDTVESLEESKEIENLLLLLCYIYHFKVVDASLIYDILNFLSNNFQPKDVELILTVLRSIGFRLRKNNPLALKALIINLQEKAAATKSSSVKVKFMMDILLAIRNNNMTKIPNYDPSYGEHLLKISKSFIHKGNYISELKISMEDLLNADSRGKWWIVGSAWTNDDRNKSLESQNIVSDNDNTENKTKKKLLKKAKALGLNTENRKNIFCIIMTAEDYIDAFEKLGRLGLKNNQEREIIHVNVYCCIHEKKFNPYYALITSRFCNLDRKYMLTLQYNLWDRIKDLDSLTLQQQRNLADLIVYYLNDKVLPLSCLKVVEFAEMDKTKLVFLNRILSAILLQQDEENMQQIYTKVAMSEKLTLFRESLRLFMGHFMLQSSITTSDGDTVTLNEDADVLNKLKAKIKIADEALLVGKGRVQL